MLIRMLLRLLAPHRWRTLLALSLQTAQTLATLLLPTLNASIIDNGIIKGDTGYIVGAGAVMLAVTIVQVTTALAATYLSAQVALTITRDLRSAVFQRVQDFSAAEVGRFGTSSLITRTITDVQQVESLLIAAFSVLVITPITCVGAIALALRQDVPLTAALIAIVPVVVVAITIILRRMDSLYDRVQASIDRINQVLGEQITGIRSIRAYVREVHERGRLSRENGELFQASLRVSRLMAIMFPLVLLIINTSGVALLWFGGHRVSSGAVGLGALSAFLTYLDLIVVSIVMAMSFFLTWPRARVSGARIRAVLDTTTSVHANTEPVPTTRSSHLELSTVAFRYPGAERPVLQDINLTAGAGETVALLGSTGSGKTTLLHLVLRHFDVTGGTIRVNGVELRELSRQQLTRTVGLVAQKPYLFAGTVASNLRFGCPDATDSQLWDALETVRLSDFVRRSPDGLDAAVAQGGTNLSGGQRQRLSIARTLLRKPQIYLFDDCFSALDAATDAAVRAALTTTTASAAVVVVAQQISSVRHADRIIVLDAGNVVGDGTHTELLRDNKTYQEIAKSQAVDEAA